MKKITPAYLRRLGACTDQVALVGEHWPNGVPLTVPSMRKAFRLGLDVEWFAQEVLSTEEYDEYERQRAPLRAEYERQQAPLWAEYQRQRAPLWAEYERQQAPLWAEYERQQAPLLVSVLRAAVALS